MYKIMIADDEGIVLESLRFIIEKEFGTDCMIESAKTGRGVIELAETYRPDIAVMDIQMPGINGIEAIRQIKERNPHIIFIIMTAYDRFNYAKEAVNLGVFEYLNKPIEKNSITQVIKNAMKKIDEERNKRSEELIIREKMENVLPIIENGLVYSIILQENFKEDIDNYRTLLEIDESYGLMAVLVCGEDQEGAHLTNAVGSSVRIQREYMGIREMLKSYLRCIVGSAMGNKIAIFIPYKSSVLDYSERISMIDDSRSMIREMKRQYNASFRIGFGSVYGLDRLSYSYEEALKALVLTDSSVAHADDVPVKVVYEEDYPTEAEKGIFGAIDKKDTEMALTNAAMFFDWMEACYPDNIDDIKLKCMEFVLWAEHLVYEQGGGVYKFLSRKDYLSTLLKQDDLAKIRSWFLNKIEEACKNSQKQIDEQSDNTVGRARKYIEEKYMNKDLSLDEVSREVDISPYYFSKLFKEETGNNFIDYLTELRIEKAKTLLSTTNHSMKEICMEVGYSDPNYFSRNFKKKVGCTPTEYKEKIGYINK